MYPWIMLTCLVIALVGIVYLSKPVEGFLTVDREFVKTQHAQLQLEGERRYNDLARVQSTSSTLSPDAINSALTQGIATPTQKNSSLRTLSQNSMGLVGHDTGTNKTGPWVENTGLIQQKINFCESLPVTCDFSDPRMAECGICHKEGTSSTSAPGGHRGGLFISSDDQIRYNEAAKASGTAAQYVPTIGSCSANNFTLVRENCQAREQQLECAHTTTPTASNRCAQCYGSSGPLLFVGTKPRQFAARLHVSHPGTNGTGMTVVTGNQTVNREPSQNAIFDPVEIELPLIREGDTITININGFPKVWCAWLTGIDESASRKISIDVGERSVSPTDAIGIVGDTRSSSVTNAFKSEPGFAAFAATVPPTVMWYTRRETIPGVPVSATYGSAARSGTNVLARLRGAIGNNQNVSVPGDIGQTAGTTPRRLWVTMDNGRSHIVADGSNLASRLTYNYVSISIQIPATLVNPYYSADVQACPTGPMIFTEIGAGLLGSNSCFNVDGTFNPNLYCMQELFEGAGGTPLGTLYPKTAAAATALVRRNAQGNPDMDATSVYLNNLGNIAMYSKTTAGAAVSFADYSDASMKMRGTTPLSFCDGPNKNTGPHTPACLDYLWRTSGNSSTPSQGSIPPYSYCGANGVLAPLNADGTPNENNISIANDKGSVEAVKAYYKDIYNSAQDVTNFATWSNSMLNCYNAVVTEPQFNLASCVPKPSPNINIVEASYGKNCNPGLRGNRTELFKSLANDKKAFNYTYDYRQTGGDPAGGCGKTLEIIYNCGGNNQKTFTVPAEAGMNGAVALSCMPTPPGINIIDASYGKNCGASLVGNRTDLFKNLANGKASLTYAYDYTKTGGDPAGGCPKTLEVNYNCNGGAPKRFTAPGEAGFGSVVNLSC